MVALGRFNIYPSILYLFPSFSLTDLEGGKEREKKKKKGREERKKKRWRRAKQGR
jgi:hypothetical protein